MTRTQAINIYFKHSRMANKILSRLLTYNHRLSLAEQSNIWKVGIGNASVFITKYGLASLAGKSRITQSNRMKILATEKQKNILKNWNPKLTIKQNAKKLGKSRKWGTDMAVKFNLKYTHHAKIKSAKVRRINRIMELSKKGVKDAEIARFFNYSREYIRQLKSDAKYL